MYLGLRIAKLKTQLPLNELARRLSGTKQANASFLLFISPSNGVCNLPITSRTVTRATCTYIYIGCEEDTEPEIRKSRESILPLRDRLNARQINQSRSSLSTNRSIGDREIYPIIGDFPDPRSALEGGSTGHAASNLMRDTTLNEMGGIEKVPHSR